MEAVKALSRSIVRGYLKLPFRGKSRLRSFTDLSLVPRGGIELRHIGPCSIALSHDHEATRNMAYGTYERREINAIRRFVQLGDTVIMLAPT